MTKRDPCICDEATTTLCALALLIVALVVGTYFGVRVQNGCNVAPPITYPDWTNEDRMSDPPRSE